MLMNYYYFDNKNKKFGKEKHFQIQILSYQ